MSDVAALDLRPVTAPNHMHEAGYAVWGSVDNSLAVITVCWRCRIITTYASESIIQAHDLRSFDFRDGDMAENTTNVIECFPFRKEVVGNLPDTRLWGEVEGEQNSKTPRRSSKSEDASSSSYVAA
jgi:hypothetical protein